MQSFGSQNSPQTKLPKRQRGKREPRTFRNALHCKLAREETWWSAAGKAPPNYAPPGMDVKIWKPAETSFSLEVLKIIITVNKSKLLLRLLWNTQEQISSHIHAVELVLTVTRKQHEQKQGHAPGSFPLFLKSWTSDNSYWQLTLSDHEVHTTCSTKHAQDTSSSSYHSSRQP